MTWFTRVITEKDDEPTFEDFVWVCARNFEALSSFKDLPLDQPIPFENFSIDTYHKDCINQIQENINKLLYSPADQLEIDFKDRLTKKIEKLKISREVVVRNRKRLIKMIENVQKWVPPTAEHENLKSFMLEELNLVLPIDGSTEYFDIKISRLNEKLANFNLRQLVDNRIAKLNHLLEYHQKRYIQVLDNYAQNQKWIKELKDSLKQ